MTELSIQALLVLATFCSSGYASKTAFCYKKMNTCIEKQRLAIPCLPKSEKKWCFGIPLSNSQIMGTCMKKYIGIK